MPLAVCATPIGNLEDVTLRVLRELAEADLVLCEDTRRTRTLLSRHDISAKLLSYHEHNEAKRTAELLPRLVAGERMALVSDAGLPGISDPGNPAGRGRDRGRRGGDRAAGCLRRGDGARRQRVRVRAVSVRRLPSAGRQSAGGAVGGACGVAARGRRLRVAAAAAKTLESLAAALPERPVAVCRELTKAFEEVVRGLPRRRGCRICHAAEGGDHPRARAWSG